jgi:hypothetical protein
VHAALSQPEHQLTSFLFLRKVEAAVLPPVPTEAPAVTSVKKDTAWNKLSVFLRNKLFHECPTMLLEAVGTPTITKAYKVSCIMPSSPRPF